MSSSRAAGATRMPFPHIVCCDAIFLRTICALFGGKFPSFGHGLLVAAPRPHHNGPSASQRAGSYRRTRALHRPFFSAFPSATSTSWLQGLLHALLWRLRSCSLTTCTAAREDCHIGTTSKATTPPPPRLHPLQSSSHTVSSGYHPPVSTILFLCPQQVFLNTLT